MTALIHYSRHPFSLQRDWDYGDTGGAFKPGGLWVSVKGEDDWPTWCRREGFRTHTLLAAHRVTLREDCPVLHLTSVEEVLSFDREYRCDHPEHPHQPCWPLVQQEFRGLVIAPYQWPLRMGLMWYYGWDCASGCIWDLEAIESFELIEEETMEPYIRKVVSVRGVERRRNTSNGNPRFLLNTDDGRYFTEPDSAVANTLTGEPLGRVILWLNKDRRVHHIDSADGPIHLDDPEREPDSDEMEAS